MAEPPEKRLRTDDDEPGRNWSEVLSADLEDIMVIEQHVSVKNLQRLISSRNIKQLVFDDDNDPALPDDQQQKIEYMKTKSASWQVNEFLQNANHKPVTEVHLRHSVIGAMLIDEGIVQASRMYPFSDANLYPYAITQLSSRVRKVAIGENEGGTSVDEHPMLSFDDRAAYHAITLTLIKDVPGMDRACEMLRAMIDDPDAVYRGILNDAECRGAFKEGITEKDVKKAIHAMANGQAESTTREKLGAVNDWLRAWAIEQMRVTDHLCNNDNAKRGVALIRKYFPKKTIAVKDSATGKLVRKEIDRDPRLTFVSYLRQDYEARGLMAKIDFFREHHIDIFLPLHDDCYASKKQVAAAEAHLGRSVSEMLTERVRAKAYDNAVVVGSAVACNPGAHRYVMSDDDAAETLISLYPSWKFCCGELYVFDDDTGMWETGESAHLKRALVYPNELQVGKFDAKKDAIVATGKNYATFYGLFRQMMPMVKARTRDERWLRDTERSSLGYLLFENGVLNGKTGVFRHKDEGFDRSLVFHKRIARPYYPSPDRALMDSIQQRLFTDPTSAEEGAFVVHALAKGLMGDNMQDGYFIIGVGLTRTGKGIVTQALRAACEEYVGTFDVETLKATATGQEPAQVFRPFLLNRYCRIIVSNEIEEKVKLSSKRLKSLAGRGDELQGRGMNQNEQPFTPHFLMLIFCNDLPGFQPLDQAVINRSVVNSYDKTFVEVPSKPNERQADPNLFREVQTIEFKDAFLHLLLEAYRTPQPEQPQAMLDAKREWLQTDQETSFEKFLAHATLSNDKSDFMSHDDMKKFMESNGITDSVTRMNKEIKQHVLALPDHASRNILGGQQQCRAGKNRKGWTGIKLVVDDFF